MTYCQDAWLGAWENFENYFTDESPAIMQAWVDAEASIKENKKSLLSAFLFRKGAKEQGGLISHLHFQYASCREQLLKKNGRLRATHWYATMCDGDATLLQRCNIVRAMHKLEIWTEIPPYLSSLPCSHFPSRIPSI